MKKVCMFAFNGDKMCFAHVLLNAIEMHEKGWKVKIVLEGKATRFAVELNNTEIEFGKLFLQVKDLGLIDSVCKACSYKVGVLDEAKALGYNINSEMYGHPSMSKFMQEGYEILTF